MGKFDQSERAPAPLFILSTDIKQRFKRERHWIKSFSYIVK